MLTIGHVVCGSKVTVPFMTVRAAKEVLALPPPIHGLYRKVDNARRSPNQRTGALVTCGNSELVAEIVGVSVNPDCTWTTEKLNLMCLQQREHLRGQRRSPHAPMPVRMNNPVATPLNNGDLE